MNIKRVAIYCQVAFDDGFSLAAQAERLQQYAKQNGYIVVGVLSEHGNGLSLDRPALAEVTQAVCAGQIDAVMVHNISPIGRGWRLIQEYVDLLTKHNVTLLCVTDGLEISNRTLFPFCKG